MTTPRAMIMAGLLLTSGCASIAGNGRRQAALVSSNPAGASIYADNYQIGTTPSYVQLTRSKSPKVELDSADGRVRLDVETSYRWRDSFFSNLIFLTYAPIGWVTDLLTGAAWNIEDVPRVRIRLSTHDLQMKQQREERPRSIAVAPPFAKSLSLSDTAAEALEQALKRSNQKFRLIPYMQTVGIFAANSYDFDGAPPPGERAQLYHDLGTTEVFESEVDVESGKLTLTGRSRDVFTQKASAPVTPMMRTSDEVEGVFAASSWWSRLLPNTVSIGTIRQDLVVTGKNAEQELSSVESEEWYNRGLDYLSAISLSNIPQRRYGRALRSTFQFVPSAEVSRKNVKASGVFDLGDGSEQHYTRLRAAAGYGFEYGLQVSRHYLYINIIPFLSWTEIAWNTGNNSHHESSVRLVASSEIGYVFFINNDWNIRLFSRFAPEDTELWKKALQERLPASGFDFTSAGVSSGGLSVGYNFTPRSDSGKWQRQSRKRR